MDFNKYLIFLEGARQENISNAAKNLGYTQSGISHTLKRMEQEMQLTLFYRDRSGAHLTESGKKLYPHIAQMVQCQENLRQTIHSLHNLHEGTLNIGTYSSISRQWLPSIIHRFKSDYPSIKVHFKEGGNEDIIRWIDRHEVDLGFLSACFHEDYEWIPLAEDPLMAVLPKNYPAEHPHFFSKQDNQAFPLEKFNAQTFIISALGTDVDIHHTLEIHDIHPDIQYSAQDDYTIISMVACNLGISILPKLVLDHHNADVLTLPLNPFTTRQLGIALSSGKLASPATLKFIAYAREYIEGLSFSQQNPLSVPKKPQ